MAKKQQKLPDINSDFSAWYNEVITTADLVDQSPTKGCVVIKPYGYAIWERIVAELDSRIKKAGVKNCYFPLLIPEAFLTKEKEHLDGFSPELAVVTHAGGKKLEEPYVIRPTSETMIYHMFARWIKSWRDLPLKINQWANVVRWEMRTRPFLRTTEFLWQEGHTAHATELEARQSTLEFRDIYVDVVENILGVPLYKGRKSKKEQFAGAKETHTIEGMMPDGKALQMGTSHLLAQSFPAAYGVQFQNKEGKMESPWCSSWGVTTRLMGALVMVHGDQNGLVLPPAIAPYQVVIVPIYRNDEEEKLVSSYCEKIESALTGVGVRVHTDLRDGRPGAKFFEWEKKGVPLRVEIGPRDCQSNQVIVARRVCEVDCEVKQTVSISDLDTFVPAELDKMQRILFARAQKKRAEQTYTGEKLSAFGPVLEKESGFYQTGWCENPACEAELARYKSDIRCILESGDVSGKPCFACDAPASTVVLVAKSY